MEQVEEVICKLPPLTGGLTSANNNSRARFNGNNGSRLLLLQNLPPTIINQETNPTNHGSFK